MRPYVPFLVDVASAPGFIPPVAIDVTACLADMRIPLPVCIPLQPPFRASCLVWLQQRPRNDSRISAWHIVSNSAEGVALVAELAHEPYDVELIRTCKDGVEKSLLDFWQFRDRVCRICTPPKLFLWRGDLDYHVDRNHVCLHCGTCDARIFRHPVSGALICPPCVPAETAPARRIAQ